MVSHIFISVSSYWSFLIIDHTLTSLQVATLEEFNLLLVKYKSGKLQIFGNLNGAAFSTLIMSSNAVDAKFFRNNDQQYLILLSYQNETLGESM